MDASDFRPSTNVEDVRDKPLWQQFMESSGIALDDLKHPLTQPQRYSDTPLPTTPDFAPQFGLSKTADALASLSANPPKSSGPMSDELNVRLGQYQSYPFVTLTPVEGNPFGAHTIPIEGDPFAGYNFRAVVGGPGQQDVPATPDAPAAQVSTGGTSDQAPPVTLTPVDHDPFARQLVPVDHNPFQ
jgi:hypothetical protein